LQETPCRPPSAPAVKRQQMTMGEDDDVLVEDDVLEKMMMFLQQMTIGEDDDVFYLFL
jgi:hypothetical protein